MKWFWIQCSMVLVFWNPIYFYHPNPNHIHCSPVGGCALFHRCFKLQISTSTDLVAKGPGVGDQNLQWSSETARKVVMGSIPTTGSSEVFHPGKQLQWFFLFTRHLSTVQVSQWYDIRKPLTSEIGKPLPCFDSKSIYYFTKISPVFQVLPTLFSSAHPW